MNKLYAPCYNWLVRLLLVIVLLIPLKVNAQQSTSKDENLLAAPAVGMEVQIVGANQICASNISVGELLSANVISGLAQTYRWYRGGVLISGAEDKTYTATSVGDYTVRISDGIQTVTSPIHTLSLIPRPNISISILSHTNLEVCPFTDFTLEVNPSNARSYSWVPNPGIIATFNNHALCALSTVGDHIFTVQVVTNDGCRYTESVTVKVIDPGTLTITGDAQACYDSSVTLTTASTMASYTWYKSTDQSTWVPITGATTNQLVTQPLISKTYYRVEGVSLGGCDVVSPVFTVNILSAENVTLNATRNYICGDSSDPCIIRANVSGSDTYSYAWYKDGALLTREVSSTMDASKYTTQGRSQNFKAIVTNTRTGCSSSSADLAIIGYVKPTMDFLINGKTDNTVCLNEPVAIQAVPSVSDGSFVWNPTTTNGSTTSYAQTTFTVAGIQTVSLDFTTKEGCSYTYVCTVNVQELPKPVIVGAHYACPGSTNQLTTSTALIGVSAYHWEKSQALTTGYIWCGSNPTLSVSDSQTYYYRLKVDYLLGCSQTSEPFLVEYHAKPTVSFSVNGSTTTSNYTSICSGESININASVADANKYSFQWLRGTNVLSNTAQLYENAPVSSNYTLLVTDKIANCVHNYRFTLIVNEKPQIHFLSSNAVGFRVCKGDPITLTAQQIGSGATYSYMWNDGTVGASKTLHPDASINAGTYKVTVTNSSGCSEVFNMPAIIVEALPEPTIMAPSQVAQGTRVTLTANPAGLDKYTWKNGAGTIVQESSTNTYTYNALTNETFTVIAENNTNCTGISDPVTVAVALLPQVIINGADEVCPSTFVGVQKVQLTAVITANGGSTPSYQWLKNGVDIVGETQATLLADAGTYSVRVSNGVTSATSSSVVVSEKSIPNYTIKIQGQSDFETCVDNTYTLEVNNVDADNYVWSSSIPGDITSSSNNICVITPTSAGSHSVSCEISKDGCTITESVNVIVNQPVNLSITGADKACYGNQVVLTASSGFTNYQWEKNESGSAIWLPLSELSSILTTQNLTKSMRYRVRAQDALHGCSVLSSVFEVNVNTLPNATIIGSSNTICAGGSDIITLTTVNGFVNYEWMANGLAIPGSASTINVTPTVSTNYTVKVTNSEGCSSISPAYTVDVTALPDFTVPSRVEICYGSDVTLKAVADPTVSFNWDGGASTASNYTLTNMTASRTIQVMGMRNGCSTIKMVDVVVKPQLIPRALISNSRVCEDEMVQISVDGDYDTYKWTVNGTIISNIKTSTINPTDYLPSSSRLVRFDLEVTKEGCTAQTYVEVTVAQTPILTITGQPVSQICGGDVVTLNAIGADEYSWNNGRYSAQSTFTKTITADEIITVKGRNRTSLCESDVETITIQVADPGHPIAVTRSYTNCQVTLTAEEGLTQYQWYRNNIAVIGATNRTYTPLQVGTYYVSAVRTCPIESNPIVIDAIDVPVVTLATLDGITDICNGKMTTLACYVTGPHTYSYAWSGGGITSTEPSIKITPTTTTTYQVVVTDEVTGCQVTKTLEIVVTNMNAPTITGPDETCAGSSVFLEAPQGFANYLWSTGSTSRVIEVFNEANYTVEVFNADGCSSTSLPHYVNVRPNPIISVPNANLEVCLGESVNLEVTPQPGMTYVWTDETGHVVGHTVNPIFTTDYTVTGTDANGCRGQAIVHVQVNPLPVVNIIPSSTIIYQGDVVTLSANCNLLNCSYQWNTGQTTSSINIPTTSVGITTYSVTVKSASSCETTQQITVSVDPKPTIAISGILDICKGESTVLTASIKSGAGTVTRWDWNHLSATSDPAVVTVVPMSTQVYEVVAYYNTTEIDRKSITVTVHDPQQATINGAATGNVTINSCEGSPTVLTAHPADAAYSWSTGERTRSITVSPTTNTTYSVAVQKDFCATTAYAHIQIQKPTNSITSSVGSQAICPGDAVTLTATPGADSYSWSNGLGNTQSITVSPMSNTTYTCEAIVGGCSAIATKLITVDTNLPQITDVQGTIYINKGNSTVLTGIGNLFVDRWEITGSNVMNQTGNSFTVAPLLTTTYTIKAYNSNNCYVEVPVTVYVVDYSKPIISGSQNACKGDDIVLTVTNYDTNLTYYWSNGASGRTITLTNIQASQDITVYGIDMHGLKTVNSDILSITVHALPDIAIQGDNEVCANTTISLSALQAPVGDNYTYQWSGPDIISGSTNRVVQVSPHSYSVCYYQVVVTNATGCSKTYTHQVIVHALPEARIYGPNSICEGETAKLKASTGTSWLWAHGGGITSQEVTVAPLTTTTYSVEISNAQGCKKIVSHTVTVNPIPNDIHIVTDKTGDMVCPDDYITLSAVTTTPSARFVWNTGETTQSIVVGPVDATTPIDYSVTAYSTSNCSAQASKRIGMHLRPTATITGDDEICEGGSATLTATGGFAAYQWSNGVIDQPMIVVTPTTTTDYSLTATDANGCQVTTTHTVVVKPKPILSITGVLAVCPGGNTKLTAVCDQAVASYNWQGPNITSSSTIQEITVTPTATSTYTCEITTLNGCTETQSVEVHIIPLTISTINGEIDGTTKICKGSSILLSAAGGIISRWSTGVLNAQSIVVAPLVTTTYTVWTKNSLGCESSTTFTVEVEDLPVAGISGKADICAGESVTLTATGATHYQWIGGIYSNNQAVTVTPAITTTYTVRVMSDTGCDDTETFTVNVHPLPIVVLKHNTPTGPETILGNMVEICRGASITLTASGGTTYAWSGDATSANSQLTVTPLNTSNYTVTVYSDQGCISTRTIEVRVLDLPTPQITGLDAICEGDNVVLTASGGRSYVWSTGETTPSITISPAATTTYSVEAFSVGGCSKTVTHTVTVNPVPIPQIITLSGKTSVCKGDFITLRVENIFDCTYLWNTGETTQQIDVNPNTLTTYTCTVLNKNGCSAFTSIDISVDELPDIVITPSSSNYCLNDDVTLTASLRDGTAADYIWDDGTIGATLTIPNIQNDQIRTVTATSRITGCVNSIDYRVNLGATSNVLITGPTMACAGETIRLKVHAVGAISYIWAHLTAPITEDYIDVVPLVNTTYRVTVNFASGCQKTIDYPVDVHVRPIASITGPTSICNGEEITLTADGADLDGHYEWLPGGQRTKDIRVNPFFKTTYSVVAVNKDGCASDPVYHTVDLHAVPVGSISGATELCEGEQTPIRADGGTHYLWNNGATTQQILVGPGSYTCVVYNIFGCTDTVNHVIKPIPFIVPQITSTVLSHCPGDVVTLTANGDEADYLYEWTNVPLSEKNKRIVTVSPMVTTNYTVRIRHKIAGCESVGQFTIPINDYGFLMSSSASVCLGEEVILSASGGDSIEWINPTGIPNNQAQVSVKPSTTTTYSCYVYNADYTCKMKCETTVTVYPVPVNYTITAPAAVCVGKPIALSIAGDIPGSTFLWEDGSTNANHVMTFMVPGTEVIQCTVTTPNGCQSVFTKSVEVHELPNASITADKLISCAGEPVILTLHDITNCTVRWFDGTSASTITVNPDVTTTYDVVVTNANGCEQAISYEVERYPIEIPTITSVDIACINDDVLLTAPAGFVEYRWYEDDVLMPLHVSNTCQLLDVQTTHIYKVEVTNNNGCISEYEKTLTVSPKPDVYVTSSNVTVNDTTISEICQSTALTLQAIGSAKRFEWVYENDATNVVSTNPVYTVITSLDHVVLLLRAYNDQGCMTEVAHTVRTKEAKKPTTFAFPNDTICEGESTILNVGNVEPGYFHWEDDTYNSNLQRTVTPPVGTTSYIAIGETAMTGCILRDTIDIVVIAKPQPVISGDNVYCVGSGNMTLTASNKVVEPGVTYTYLWSTGETTPTIEVAPTSDTDYTVTMTNNFGCETTTASYTVKSVIPQDPIITGTLAACKGYSTTLTVSSSDFVSCVWSNGETTTSADFNPIVPTTYWVDVTNTGGCVTRKTFTVDVYELPDPFVIRPSVGTKPNVCYGDSIKLYADVTGSGFDFEWYESHNPNVVLGRTQYYEALPLNDMDYFCRITNVNGCYRDSRYYSIHILRSAETLKLTTSADSICTGQSVTITASGVTQTTYHWTLPDGTETTGKSVTINPTLTGEVICKAQAPDCDCVLKATKTITVLPYATVNILGPTTNVCVGTPVLLTATGADTYKWDKGNQSTDTITVYPTQTHNEYFVTGYNKLGCETRQSIVIETWPLPILTVVGPDAIYKGQTVVLTASPAYRYEWYVGSTLISTDRFITIKPDVTTTYTCITYTEHDCLASVEHTVTVSDYETTILGANSLCSGETVQLEIEKADPAYKYLWSTGDITPQITIAPIKTTTFTCQVTTDFGVVYTASFTVLVHPLPRATFSQVSYVCKTESSFYIECTIESGAPSLYSIEFDAKAKAAGFVDIDHSVLTIDGAEVQMPGNVDFGYYTAQIYLYNQHGCKTGPYNVDIQISSPNMVVEKWDDVLVCNDFNHEFIQYQWYKDEKAIPEANKQYYSEESGFNGSYFVIAKNAKGQTFVSCPMNVRSTQRAKLHATPNPVKRNGLIRFQIPLTDQELENAVLQISDMTGHIMYKTSHVNQIQDYLVGQPQGAYIVQVLTPENGNYYVKFIVTE